MPWIDGQLTDILYERYERVVDHELQIPADRHRCHYVKARATVLRYPNRPMVIMHSPRKLATYDSSGKEIKPNNTVTYRVNPPLQLADNSFATKPDISICC